MPTTFPQIRNQQILTIEAITPSVRSDQLFRVHRDELEFVEWCNANPQACWRRFEVLSNHDIVMSGLTNAGGPGTVWQFEHSEALVLAYPRRELGRYGIDNERSLDDMIEGDLAQIDQAIGLDGYISNYVSGLDVCERTGVAATKTDQVVFVQSTYRLLYDRSY
jgi:hypothetical protein